MSIIGRISDSGGSLNGPIFHEFKKQASFFLKEKIKTARLAFTDVTPAQLLTEEATNGNPVGPDARNLKIISRAAFDVDDYYRIVEILHKRFVRFDSGNWRASYKALIVLEHLLTHGPERVAEEFQCDIDVIREMESFQHIDDKGYNWGLNVRKKSERVLNLLEKGPLLKQERDKARKITRGIQGFGSFCLKTSSEQEILQECNSEFTHHTNQEDFFSVGEENVVIETKTEKNASFESLSSRVGSKENFAPTEGVIVREINDGSWDLKPLLAKQKDESMINTSMADQHHPFDDADDLTALSLLSSEK